MLQLSLFLCQLWLYQDYYPTQLIIFSEVILTILNLLWYFFSHCVHIFDWKISVLCHKVSIHHYPDSQIIFDLIIFMIKSILHLIEISNLDFETEP